MENARYVSEASANWLIPESELNATRLASEITERLQDSEALQAALAHAVLGPGQRRRAHRAGRRVFRGIRKIHFVGIGGIRHDGSPNSS